MSEYPIQTVATADVGGGNRAVIVRAQSGAGVDGWVTVYSDGSHDFNPDGHVGEHRNIRRLVVLDLSELDSQPETIVRAIRRAADSDLYSPEMLSNLVDQIEAQIQPPKPEEPKEFGAKVTAVPPGRSDSRRWLLGIGNSSGERLWQDSEGREFLWHELSAVTLGWDDEDGAS